MSEKSSSLPTSQIAMVPMKVIKVDPKWNVRERLMEIDELAMSIKNDGQRQPGVLVSNNDGTYRLIEGFRRYAACKRIGAELFFAQIREREQDPSEARWSNILENIHRHGLTGYEFAKGLADYAKLAKLPKRGRGVAMSERFGAHTEKGRLSPASVNNYLRAYEQLSEKSLKAWARHEIIDDVAFALAARDKNEQDKILTRAKNMGAQSFREMLHELDNPSTDDGNGGSNGDDNASTKKSVKRPSKTAIEKGIVWARECGFEDVEQVLRWVLGLRQTMSFESNTFNPKTWKSAAELEATADDD